MRESNKQTISRIEEHYTIVVIGSGGTGTLFLPAFTRMVMTGEASKKVDNMYVIDGDRVEEKNLARQNFVLDDIGSSKSITYSNILNDGLIDEIVRKRSSQTVHWVGYDRYITELSDLHSLLTTASYTEQTGDTLYLGIPLIIGCVDNDHCRFLCEKYFHDEKVENCFYYDAGNELSSGEVVFAHKLNGIVLSPVKSHYFNAMTEDNLKPVTEMSCEELNESHPQHIVTNMGAAWLLMTGVANLFSNTEQNVIERIQSNLGYVTFDKDCHGAEFVAYKK